MRIAVVAALCSIVAVHAQLPQPPRDRAGVQDPAGTGVIRGKITNTEGRPLRRVQLSLVGEPLTQGKSTSTDSQGKYEVTGLPAGRFTVTASRTGYQGLSYGQTRPGEAPRQIDLAVAQVIENVDITLARSVVVAGRVLDEAGEPLAGASVVPMQMRFYNGRRQLLPVGSIAQSDDTGQYRVRGLEPGEYFIRATSRETWQSDPPKRETMAFLPTFYPSSTSAGLAQRVRVRYGQELPGIDIGMIPGKVVTVSGTALSSQGQPLAGETVDLSFEIRGENFMSSYGAPGTKVNPDGTFVFRNVVPGDYVLRAQYRPQEGPPESARAAINVATDDFEGVQLVTVRAGSIIGRVVVDSTAALPFPLTRLTLRPVAVDRDAASMSPGFMPEGGKLREDGSFELKGLVSAYRLSIVGMPDAWAIRSIDVDGRDVMTSGIDPLGQSIDRVTVTITDKFATVTGSIRDDKGNPVSSATAVLFPEDAAQWIQDLRTVRTARLTQSGTFAMKAVRPGDYLAIALPSVRSSEWNDPEFLESLRERATRVTVSEAHTPQLDLLVTRLDDKF